MSDERMIAVRLIKRGSIPEATAGRYAIHMPGRYVKTRWWGMEWIPYGVLPARNDWQPETINGSISDRWGLSGKDTILTR